MNHPHKTIEVIIEIPEKIIDDFRGAVERNGKSIRGNRRNLSYK